MTVMRGEGSYTSSVRSVLFVAVVLVAAACSRDKAQERSAPSADEAIALAAMQRFELASRERDQVEVFSSGAGEAAIARDKRTGFCLVLSKTADGRWEAHGMFKGTPGAQDLSQPLTSAGTLQEGVTREDLKRIAAEHCR
jgi:hypothetical protein